MSDNDSLNDPELSQLERRLAAVELAPSSREREQTLYACGQAVGRAQMQGRGRAIIAAAGVLIGVSTGINAFWLLRPTAEQDRPEAVDIATVENDAKGSKTDVSVDDRQWNDTTADRTLSVGASYEELAEFDRTHRSAPIEVDVSGVPSNRVLTAASRLWRYGLWD